jgi:hypothetical protein
MRLYEAVRDCVDTTAETNIREIADHEVAGPEGRA